LGTTTDSYDVIKSGIDGRDGYNDNDGMASVQIVYIVLAVLTGLCSLYKCLGGTLECLEDTSCSSCACCACEDPSHMYVKAVEEAPHEVKRLALAACDNTQDRFDSYEGDFRGKFGLNLKLKDNGTDGYEMEGNGHTNRTTRIVKATVYYSGHAYWLEHGQDQRGYDVLNIGKFDFKNDIFVGTWRSMWESGSFSLHGNVVKTLKSDNDSDETQQALSNSRDVSFMSIEEIKEELQSYGINTSLLLGRDELTAALDMARQNSRAQDDFSVKLEGSKKESVEEPSDKDKTPYSALEEGVASSALQVEGEKKKTKDPKHGNSKNGKERRGGPLKKIGTVISDFRAKCEELDEKMRIEREGY